MTETVRQFITRLERMAKQHGDETPVFIRNRDQLSVIGIGHAPVHIHKTWAMIDFDNPEAKTCLYIT